MTAKTLLGRLDKLKDDVANDAAISPAQKLKAFTGLLVEAETMIALYMESSAREVWIQEMIPYEEYWIKAENEGGAMEDDRQPYTTTGGEEVAEESCDRKKKDILYMLTNMYKEIMNEIRKLSGPLEIVPGLEE